MPLKKGELHPLVSLNCKRCSNGKKAIHNLWGVYCLYFCYVGVMSTFDETIPWLRLTFLELVDIWHSIYYNYIEGLVENYTNYDSCEDNKTNPPWN